MSDEKRHDWTVTLPVRGTITIVVRAETPVDANDAKDLAEGYLAACNDPDFPCTFEESETDLILDSDDS